MNEWQWKVVMALVRYVIFKEGLPCNYLSSERAAELTISDRNILIEASNREF